MAHLRECGSVDAALNAQRVRLGRVALAASPLDHFERPAWFLSLLVSRRADRAMKGG
jgi:hypothetical protein